MTTSKSAAGVATAGVLGTSCVSTFVVNANTSAVSILLPSIGVDLDGMLGTENAGDAFKR